MFGGCAATLRLEQKLTAETTSAQPPPPTTRKPPNLTNDLYKVDVGSETEYYWTKINPGNDDMPEPVPCWHHSANSMDDDSCFVVFGGFTSAFSRYRTASYINDVWIFDVCNESWWQPKIIPLEEEQSLLT